MPNFPYCLLCGEGLGGQTIATTLGNFHAICYNKAKLGSKDWREEDAKISAAIEEFKAREGKSNAVSTREIPQSNQREYTGIDQIGAPTKASRGDSPVNIKKGRKKKIAESIAA